MLIDTPETSYWTQQGIRNNRDGKTQGQVDYVNLRCWEKTRNNKFVENIERVGSPVGWDELFVLEVEGGRDLDPPEQKRTYENTEFYCKH